MYGDRSGPSWQDDRQGDGSPAPYADDVKVAGVPVAGAGTTDVTRPVTHVEYVTADGVPAAADALGEDTIEVAAGDTAYLPGDGGEVTRDDLPPVRENDHPSRSPARWKAFGTAVAAVAVVGGGSFGGWVLSGAGDEPAADRGPVQAQGPAPLTDAQRRAVEARRIRELKVRASRAARDDDSRPMLFLKGQPPEPRTPEPSLLGAPTPVGEAQRIARAMLPDFGWKPSQHFGCLVDLWNRESHWNTHAGSPSGAYGIPQALPGSKMANSGSDWRDSARTQIKWGLGYIRDRYSSPCDAWQHSQATGWY